MSIRAACAAVALLTVAGCAATTFDVRRSGGSATAAATGPASLTNLTIAPESHADSYSRAAFGQRWKDTDRNGCGQRDDVLRRDLSGVQLRGRCVVIGGLLVDPYTGQQVTFTKARADDVQIDHVVSLAEAWRSGAWAWTPGRREEFANELAELQATAGPVNTAKGDDDPATWHPAGAARTCAYAQHVMAIKTTYQLSVDPAERAALLRDVTGCRP